MINFGQFKKDALSQLKGRWNVPVLVTILVFAILYPISYALSKSESLLKQHGEYSLIIEILVSALSGIIVTALSYFYLKMSRTQVKMSINDFLVGLGDYYLPGILGFLWYMLWVTIWSMLFLIPGIIKSISYSMMFYIIVENPGISVTKAMNISKVMTFGHKSEIFCFAMTFLGWFILSCLTFGIGFFWLVPYMSLSSANLYTALKMEAILRGTLTPSDFTE